MSKRVAIFVVLGAVALAAAFIFYPKDKTYSQLDDFARCLSSKGAVMYGADWCPHCQNEKKAFGDSFRFVNYVECPADPQKCISAGINGYPTWIFTDGRKLEGEQGLDKLSMESSCPLPNP